MRFGARIAWTRACARCPHRLLWAAGSVIAAHGRAGRCSGGGGRAHAAGAVAVCSWRPARRGPPLAVALLSCCEFARFITPRAPPFYPTADQGPQREGAVASRLLRGHHASAAAARGALHTIQCRAILAPLAASPPPPSPARTLLTPPDLTQCVVSQWDKVENKTGVVLYGAGAVVLLWLSSAIVSAIDHVPLVRVWSCVYGYAYGM